MAISENIEVNAGEAIASVDDLATAFGELADKAAASVAKIKSELDSIGGGGAGAAGADKIAASMDKAAASIDSAVARINGAMDKVGGAADSAAAGIGRLDEAAATAEESLTAAAAGADEAAAASDRLAASADAAGSALDREALAGTRAGEASAKGAEAGAAGFMKFAKVALIGFGVAAAYGIDKAMGLNAEVTRLYTAAGLTHAPLQQVTQDVLTIGTKTGYTGEQIAQAMYHPISAGLSLQTSLGLVAQSANLANIHGANLEDTTYALSSTMKAYNLSTKDVIPTAALLNSIVGQGDMRFQDYNESVKNWAPTGASMGISIQSMGAGLAYLTDRGNSAEVASTRLTMGLSMATAGSKAANVYLKDLGLTTGNLELKNKSLQATMLAGGLSTNKFAADLKKPDGLYVALNDMQKSFEKAGLTSGQADQVMAKIFGGGRSDKAIVSLMQNLDGVKQKYEQIGQGVAGYGSSVDKEQATAAQKWKDFIAGSKNLATGFGNTLLPAFTSLVGEADKFLSLLQGSKGAADALVGTAGALAAIFAGNKLAGGIKSAFQTGESMLRGIGKVAQVLHIPGLDKLATLGQGSTGAAALDAAAGNLDGAAEALTGAAEALTGAAEKLGGAGGLGGAGKGAAAAEGTTAAEAGGAGGILAAARAALGPVSIGIGIGSIIKAIGDTIAPAGSQAGKYNAMLQKTPQTNDSSLMPYIFGGFEGKLMSSIGPAIGGAISNAIHFGASSFDTSRHQAASAGNFAAGSFDTSRHEVASIGHDIGSFFGLGSRPAPAPAQAPATPDMLGHFTTATSAQLAKPVKVPAPDLSALADAKAKAAQDMAGIGQALHTAVAKPAKIAAPDLSALVEAKGKAAQYGLGVTTAIETPLHKPVKAASPDLSAFAAAKGAAAADGAQISAGLAQGIEAGKGAVVAAANDVAAAAAAAMAHAVQTHSPSRVTDKTGQDVAAGLAQGITKGKAKVKAAAVSLSAATITSLTQGLQGGQPAIDAALQAISGKGSRPQDITTIINTISTLKGDVATALKDKQISKAEDSALVKMLTADNAKLQALSARRTMLETEITDAQQITQQAISGASIMTAGTATPYDPSTVQSSYSLIQGQQYQADQAKQFAAAIAQDKKLGLNATSLNQIIQSGAASGLPVAQGIAQGGKGTVTQLNALQAQIQSSAAKLGNEGAGPMYQAGVQAGQGVAAGIKSQLGAVDSAIRQMADSMVAEMKKDLKIKSPSQVFRDEALSIPQGVASGVDAGTPIAQAAVTRMGNSLGGRLSPYHPGLAYGHPAAGGSSGPSGGGGHTTVIVNIAGSLVAQQDLGRAVQNALLVHGNSNWQAGLVLPGRRT